jgi:hypothetical protein
LCAANAHEYEYNNINANPHEHTDAHRDSDTDVHHITHFHPHRDAGARQQSMGQLHRDCGGVFSQLCPQQCG